MSIQKLLKKETVVESAGIILFFTIIERMIQTFRGIIFARLLGPSEYGVFSLAFFFIPLVVALAKVGIPACYARYVPQYEKKGMTADFFRRNYLLAIGAGVFFTVFFLIFSKQISELLYASTEYKHIIILCALTLFPYVLYENLFYSFNGLRVFKMSALLRFSQFFIFTMLGITFVIFYPNAKSLISANLISFIFVSSAFGFIVWKYVLNSTSQNLKIQEDNFYSKIFKYSVWFVVTPVVSALFTYTDRWMLNRFLGLEEVGVYSIAINIALLIFVFGMVAGNVLMPNLSHIWEKGEKDRVIFLLNLAVKINVIFLLLCAVILALFKEEIIPLLYGQAYIKSISVVNILLIFSISTSISWTIGAYIGIIEKTYILLVSNIIGFICNLILNYMLIPLYQMEGAAIATTTSFIISLITMSAWLFKNGLRLKPATIFICIFPVILMLGKMLMCVIFFVIVVLVFSTNLFIKKDEKNLIFEQVRKTFFKYRRV